jgi:two-component system, LytTR family, response regulator
MFCLLLSPCMLHAVIIDDEERSRHVLASLLEQYCPSVQIAGTASNVPEGVLAINKHKPDVVFLDVEMPEYSGFELLDFFREIDFEIIFVTAYSQYAIRAFEVSAVGYLLKPVEIDSLQQAVDRVKQRKQQVANQQRLQLLRDTMQSEEVRRIALPMGDGLMFVEVTDIVFLEADGAYTHVFLRNGSKILVSKRLKFFEDVLANRKIFFRPHRSHLININCIRKYVRGEGTLMMDNNSHLSLSRERKMEFETLLKDLNLSI